MKIELVHINMYDFVRNLMILRNIWYHIYSLFYKLSQN